MISERYEGKVFIADFTDYDSNTKAMLVPYKGVVVGEEDNGIIPSFVIHNENGYPFIVINNEHNPAMFKRSDGSKVSQCECMVFAERNDNRKGWMCFLELKYCEAKNRYARMQEGIWQLKETCNHIFREKQVFDASQFKKYLVISTPGVKPLDPFDEFYFDQDYLLTVQEETGAFLRAVNEAWIKTPAVIELKA